MINLSGGIGRAVKRVVSAPVKAVGKVVGNTVGRVFGFGKTVNVSVPDAWAAQVVPSTASPAPEAPVLGTENTTQDKVKKKKGKSRLLINSDSSPSSGNSSYSGLNI